MLKGCAPHKNRKHGRKKARIHTDGGWGPQPGPAVLTVLRHACRQQMVCKEGGMGRYIEEILQPEEKVLFATTIQWII